MKRAEKGLEMLERRRRPSTLKEPATANRFSSSGPASETLGQSSFAGNESDGEMCTVRYAEGWGGTAPRQRGVLDSALLMICT